MKSPINNKVLFGIIALVLLSGIFENPSALVVFIILMGFVYNSRQQNAGQQRPQVKDRDIYPDDEEDEEPYIVRRHKTATDPVYPHALDAVRRAGIDPDTMNVLPVDIGLMSYHGNDQPQLHRKQGIRDDCDYIQPFVQLRVPQMASGRVKFEIRDNKGKPVFIHEDEYQLERGRNLIIPSTRLPIHDEQWVDGDWSLSISGDDFLLAEYMFEWMDSQQEGGIREHIGEDGEINSEMRAVLSESRLDSLSLDDLLAFQDDEGTMQGKA